MLTEQISLGEHIRRLRRAQKMNLQTLAQKADLSYTHLSRIENDSTIPKPETIVDIAEALGADIKPMLELADNLPRQILDRISTEEAGGLTLHRAAYQGQEPPDLGHTADLRVADLARIGQLDAVEMREFVSVIQQMAQLPPERRNAIMNLVHSLYVEEGT